MMEVRSNVGPFLISLRTPEREWEKRKGHRILGIEGEGARKQAITGNECISVGPGDGIWSVCSGIMLPCCRPPNPARAKGTGKGLRENLTWGKGGF